MEKFNQENTTLPSERKLVLQIEWKQTRNTREDFPPTRLFPVAEKKHENWMDFSGLENSDRMDMYR
jgi:hypothetical protein